MSFKCQLCNKPAYKIQRYYNNHMAKKHPGQTVPASVPDTMEGVNLSRYCKYFYDQMRKEGKTNDIAKNILLELILLKKLSERLHLYKFTEEERQQLSFDNLCQDPHMDGEVTVRIQQAIEIYRYSDLHTYFLADNSSYYNNLNIKMMTALVNRLKTVSLEIGDDFIGDIYEESITSSSRQMGQFFTSTKLKDIALGLVTIKAGDRIIDPSMGSAGFIIHVGETARRQGVDVELYGGEIDDNVYNVALLNLLIRLDLSADRFIKVDSIKEYVQPRYAGYFDIIVSNPPFGGKDANNFHEVFKIKNKILDCLFLQLYIYMLRDGGQCSIVMPQSILTAKDRETMDLRRYLIESCTVRKIYIDESKGGFTNTTAHTCIIYFTKGPATPEHEIEFIKITDKGTNPLVKISYRAISKKSYMMYYQRFIDHDNITDGHEYVALSTIYEKKQLTLVKGTDAIFKCYGGGRAFTELTADYNSEGFVCKISDTSGGSFKSTVMLLDERFFLKEHGFIVSSKDSRVPPYYLNVWLWANNERVNKCYRGVCQQSIDMDMFGEIMIPLITTEQYEEFYELTRPLIMEMTNVNRLIQSTESLLEIFIRNTWRKFRSIGELRPIADLIKYKKIEQFGVKEMNLLPTKTTTHPFRFYNASEVEHYSPIYNHEGRALIMATSNKFIINIGHHFTISTHNWIFNSKGPIDDCALWLLLMVNRKQIASMYHGTIHQHITKEDFGEIEIRVPPEGFDYKPLADELIELKRQVIWARKKEEYVRRHIHDLINEVS